MIGQAIGRHRVRKITRLLQADSAVDQGSGVPGPQCYDLLKSLGRPGIVLDVLQGETEAEPSVGIGPIKSERPTKAGERPSRVALRSISLRGAEERKRRFSGDVDGLCMAGALREADGRRISRAINVSAQQGQQRLELLRPRMTRCRRQDTIDQDLRLGIALLAIDLDRLDESLI